MLIRIESNVYDIPQRLREIDPNYYVVLNTDTQKYEVHHSKQIGGTLCLNLPFDELDSRTIDYVKSHDIKYAKQIFEEIDMHNAVIEREAKRKAFDEPNQKVKEIHRYVTKYESKETVPDDAYKTRFI